MWPVIVIAGFFVAVGYLILSENVKRWFAKRRSDGDSVMMSPPPATHNWSKHGKDD
jgi:hypothetical protein